MVGTNAYLIMCRLKIQKKVLGKGSITMWLYVYTLQVMILISWVKYLNLIKELRSLLTQNLLYVNKKVSVEVLTPKNESKDNDYLYFHF